MVYAHQMALPGSLQGSPLEGSPGLDPGRTLRASVLAVRAGFEPGYFWCRQVHPSWGKMRLREYQYVLVP